MTAALVLVAPGMKCCPKCRAVKPFVAFGKNKARRDGMTAYCRPCYNAVEAGRRRALGDAYRDREKARRARHSGAFRLAHQAVGAARRAGRLVSPRSCTDCGQERRVEAHHHKGYAREHWLDVVWVCRSCHALRHRREDQEQQGRAA